MKVTGVQAGFMTAKRWIFTRHSGARAPIQARARAGGDGLLIPRSSPATSAQSAAKLFPMPAGSHPPRHSDEASMPSENATASRAPNLRGFQRAPGVAVLHAFVPSCLRAVPAVAVVVAVPVPLPAHQFTT